MLDRQFFSRFSAVALTALALLAGCGGGGGSSTTVTKTTPTLTWATPTAVTVGTTLGTTQLDATASVAGTFAYTPASGTVLSTAGSQTLSVTFTPSDTTDYNSATASVTLTVNKATPTITWATPTAVTVGTALSATQLDATASVAGTFTYTPASGTVLSTAGTQKLSASFTPTDSADYNTAIGSVNLQVNAQTSGTPSYTWNNAQIIAGGYVPGVYFSKAQKNLMFARTDVGGAYRWGPNDTQWVPLMDWTTRANYGQIGVEAIGLDPTNSAKLYIAAGMYAASGTVSWDNNQPGVMLVSSDTGATFTTVSLGFYNGSNDNGRNTGERIAVDPNLPSTVYFGTRSAGLQISTNSGLAWSQMTGLVLPSNGVTQPNNSTGVSTANNNGVIAVLPVKSSGSSGTATPVVYAAVAGTGSGTDPKGVWVSTNAGSTSSTWTAVTGQPSVASISCTTASGTNSTVSLAPLEAQLGPSGNLYVLYGDQAGPGSMTCSQLWEFTPTTGTWTSGTWKQITLPNATFAINSADGYGGIAVDPTNAGVLLLSTLDQYWPTGDVVYRSDDDGATWRDVASIKLPSTYSPNDASPNLATHDDSLSPWLGFGRSDAYVSTGNWATSMAIDPYNADHAIYGTGQTIWSTTNLTVSSPTASSTGVVNWTVGAKGLEETCVNTVAAPPSGKTLLLSTMGDLYGFAHTDLTVSPAQQNFTNPGATPTSLDFAYSAPATVVRVTSSSSSSTLGSISTDNGITWAAFAAFPTGSTSGGGTIAVSADASSLVWAPADTSSVWYSTNNGASWTASTGVPAQAQVVADRAKAGVFYGLSSGTLYRSTDGGKTFASVQTGLPTANLVSLPDAQGDLWMAGGSWNGGTSLYANTGTATAPNLTTVSSVTTAYHVGFGVAASGSSKLTLYLDGTVSGVTGIFRSVDGGSTWIQINDTDHVWGMLNGLAGDMRTFGTVYLATGCRGVIYGTSTN